ncbi:hypothetical protein Ade02nite_24710 [Paractinoplanes deccanensis]|uniref:ABC transporter permease n=1 Tax=Paractinoplanes deccanensis TaxID=113561 RepID=A0ABQ3Y1U0_9ACTN|nr:hypothetical protein [Actinoplanes deccanensis]GID73830.1 hypothetical protein Ade02nite_24710 [Actinoplanes deccanensis]
MSSDGDKSHADNRHTDSGSNAGNAGNDNDSSHADERHTDNGSNGGSGTSSERAATGTDTGSARATGGGDARSRLGGRYRVLLRAYPKGRRREELLDTLLEAAPGGRRRPTGREAVNLIRHGLRARLGRPGSRGVVVLASMVALIAGFLGAAVASRVAWEFVPGYPSGAGLTAISGTLFPGVPATAERDADGLFHDLGEPSTAFSPRDEDFAFATVILSPEKFFLRGDYRSWTAAAQDRLVAAGWQVEDAAVTGPTLIATGELDDTGRSFSATRGGLALTVESMTDVVDTPAGSFYATARLDRLTPGYVTAATLAGLAAGALIGWLITGWASRRTETITVWTGHGTETITDWTGHGTKSRSTKTRSTKSRSTQSRRTGIAPVALVPAVFALVLLVPQAALGLLIFGTQAFADSPPVQPFWALTMTYGYGCTVLGAALSLVSLGAAALGRRAAHDPPVEVPR